MQIIRPTSTDTTLIGRYYPKTFFFASKSQRAGTALAAAVSSHTMNLTSSPLTSRAWCVLLVAWLGWGFDVFDALLFNFVAPNCIPTLLHLPLGSQLAKAATAQWTGILTALLLVGWALGGTLFGYVADRIGRERALILTILVYALGTASCALAPSLPVLIVCRAIASLGIGGEWAAGATLVAETVPSRHRLLAGALLQTASPLGLFLAMGMTWLIAGHFMADSPATSWRYVFACGLLPVLIVLIARVGLSKQAQPPRTDTHGSLVDGLLDLFSPTLRKATLSALAMSVVAITTWWCCNAFLPAIANTLGSRAAVLQGLSGGAAVKVAESWKATTTLWFNFGGIVGALLAVPLGHRLGRRALFAAYYGTGALALLFVFGIAWPPEVTLRLTFFVGVSIYGVFGALTFYLPELFPSHHRALGAGFCYNTGRLLAAAGPFLVGAYSAQQVDPLRGALTALTAIAVVPLLAAIGTPWISESGLLNETRQLPQT